MVSLRSSRLSPTTDEKAGVGRKKANAPCLERALALHHPSTGSRLVKRSYAYLMLEWCFGPIYCVYRMSLYRCGSDRRRTHYYYYIKPQSLPCKDD